MSLANPIRDWVVGRLRPIPIVWRSALPDATVLPNVLLPVARVILLRVFGLRGLSDVSTGGRLPFEQRLTCERLANVLEPSRAFGLTEASVPVSQSQRRKRFGDRLRDADICHDNILSGKLHRWHGLRGLLLWWL